MAWTMDRDNADTLLKNKLMTIVTRKASRRKKKKLPG